MEKCIKYAKRSTRYNTCFAVEHYFHTGIYRERKRKEEKLVTTIGCSLSLVWISQVT